jgi:hypothetical protein
MDARCRRASILRALALTGAHRGAIVETTFRVRSWLSPRMHSGVAKGADAWQERTARRSFSVS